MRFEEAKGLRIPKVGFGTWSIGGDSLADHRRDQASLAALRSALDIGYRHFDTAESYADGHCEQLLGQAIRDSDVNREDLFITSKVKPENLTTQRTREACEKSLRRLGLEYLDLYLIHWPNRALRLEDTFQGLNQLVRERKVHHLGVSNFDLEMLKRAMSLSESPILTNQVPYSVMERTYAENGVLEYCQAHDVLLTAYSPLEQKGLRMGRGLGKVAQARSLTVHQTAIAWLCSQDRVITIPMSGDSQHQRDNIAAADVVLTASELAEIA